MARKFSELTPSEQVQFQGLVDFMKETWNEDIQVKLNIVKKFRLDISDPVVYNFLTDVYVPTSQAQPSFTDTVPKPATTELVEPPQTPFVADEPLLPTTTVATKPVEKTKKREMTYANSEDLIIIQNRLLHAISHLTLNERRLILFLSPIVRKSREVDPYINRFVIRSVDFADEYNLKKDKVYQVLENTADTILEKAFWFWNFKDNNPFGKRTHKTGLSWVTRCDYIKTKGEIVVELHNSVIEMLTIFDGNGDKWTKYQKDWITKLGSYGIVMLEIVLSSKYLSSPDDNKIKGYITIEHLREKFDCVGSYEKFSNFRIWVIDKAIQEIHKNTPIQIKYNIHKTGRSVTALSFSYIDTSEPVKELKDKTKNSDDKPKENNPFANFKMTPKQLAVFGAKIAKKIDKDIEVVIDEISNVHLQGQYVEYLKLLDFVPSDWYSDDEIKDHLTPQQIDEQKKQAKQAKANQEKLDQAQLEQDFEKLLANAEEFVLANQKRLGFGIEKMYLEQGNYQAIVRIWQSYLLDKDHRKHFAMVNEILECYL